MMRFVIEYDACLSTRELMPVVIIGLGYGLINDPSMCKPNNCDEQRNG